MDPFTAFQVVATVAGGVAQSSAAMDEAARLDSQAKLAETQALQRDTQNRDELARFLSTVAAARGANGLSMSSPNAYVLQKDAIETSDDERLRQRADDRQEAANFRAAAKSSRRSAKMSLITGVASAGVPLADYGSTKGWW